MRLLAVCAALAFAAAGLPQGRVVSHAPHIRVRRNSYILEFHDHTPADLIRAMPGVTVERHYRGRAFGGMAVTTAGVVLPRHLADIPGVRTVYPNRVYRLDVQRGLQNATADTLHEMTGLTRTLRELELDGRGVKIGIIDTGVDYEHPDLGGCWKTEGCPWQFGYDFVGDEYDDNADEPVLKPDEIPNDCVGHGTHVAGIIMARGSGGVQGVAPAATMGMYRVFGCPSEDQANESGEDVVVAAMERAISDGVDIINMSLGSGGFADDAVSAFATKAVAQGVVIVAANGNSGVDGLLTTGSPAAGRGVISVGSTENYAYWSLPAVFTTARGTIEVPKSADGTPDHPFVFNWNVPVVAPKDSGESSTGCSPFTENLGGKVALIDRGGCSFLKKTGFAQKAGAVGVVFANNVDGMVSIAVANATIPTCAIKKADGEAVKSAIEAGPVTLRASASQHSLFPADNGGQISPFSSYGPSPDLDLTPIISAPGGNIWSTYPRDKDSYSSLSGTSMATPYISGAVALIKQARPELSVEEIREVLVTTATPITDPKTGLKVTPYQGGAGLVNIYRAIKSRALISPPTLAVNDTEWDILSAISHRRRVARGGAAIRTLEIQNTDRDKRLYVSVGHAPASSVTMYNPNGTIASAVENQLPLPTWPPDNSSHVRADTLPSIYTLNPTTSVGPGSKGLVTLHIYAPSGLKEADRWFYGGLVNLTLRWEGEKEASDYVVPFGGFNGRFCDLNILSKDPDVPAIVDGDGVPVDLQRLQISTAENSTFVAFVLDMPSRNVSQTFIDQSGRVVGFVPSSSGPNIIRNQRSVAPGYVGVLDGTVCADVECMESEELLPGKYHVHLKVLRIFGDPNNDADYETWDSGQFEVVKSQDTASATIGQPT